MIGLLIVWAYIAVTATAAWKIGPRTWPQHVKDAVAEHGYYSESGDYS